MTTGSRYDIPGKIAPPIHVSAALRSFFGPDTTRCTFEEVHSSTGRSEMRWFAVKEPSECRSLALNLLRKTNKKEQRKRQELMPRILRALRIRELMPVWAAGGDFYDIMKEPCPDGLAACIGIPQHLWDMAACAIACGHFPQPRMTGGVPFIMGANITTGATLQDLAAAEVEIQKRYTPGYLAKAVTIPGAEPEEHPFFYCRQAIYHLDECRAAEAAARKNPTGMFKGRYGRSAIVSKSVAEKHEKILTRHLSGMPI